MTTSQFDLQPGTLRPGFFFRPAVLRLVRKSTSNGGLTVRVCLLWRCVVALRSLCLAAVLAALAVSPNPANAMGQGRLLFVNPNSGAWALGGVDQVGHYQLEVSGSSSLSLGNETNLLSVPGFALSYAATTGKGTAVFDTHGIVSFLRGFSFS